MASSLRVSLLLLVSLVLGLAMTKSLSLMEEIEDGDIMDEEVQFVVDFAIQKYNMDSKDQYLFRVAQVVRVRQQVGLGMNYYLDLEIGRTTCAKDQPTQDDCPFSEEQMRLCSFVVGFRAWEYYLELTSSSCHNA